MRPPVFIVGCPRSGTSFLYHLLLSSGGYARFHTQMNVFDVLEPIYGDLRVRKNKSKMMSEWLETKAFAVSGLDAADLEAKVLARCENGSDFLKIVMEEIASKQGVDGWVDSTPTNAPHMMRIHRDFPGARFIHIIRDPRDVALSLDKRGWTRPLPWDKGRSLLAAGLYWEWIVRKARKYGAQLGACYREVRYESLVSSPGEELARLGSFLEHDLDYERIRQSGIGSVRDPLTSFKEDLAQGEFSPVGRWKSRFPQAQLAGFEKLIGDYMQELGYPPSALGAGGPRRSLRGMRLMYGLFFEFKQWAKIHTPASRWLVNYGEILIDK